MGLVESLQKSRISLSPFLKKLLSHHSCQVKVTILNSLQIWSNLFCYQPKSKSEGAPHPTAPTTSATLTAHCSDRSERSDRSKFRVVPQDLPFLVWFGSDVSFSCPNLDLGRSNLPVGGLKIHFRPIYIEFTHFLILVKILNLLKLLPRGGRFFRDTISAHRARTAFWWFWGDRALKMSMSILHERSWKRIGLEIRPNHIFY